MKTILKIAVILVIVVVFVGTIVYLYKKSQAEPVVFETTTAFKTDIIRKTCCYRIGYSTKGDRNHTKGFRDYRRNFC